MKCLHNHMLTNFHQDMITLLTSSLASSKKPAIVEGAASALFNFIQVLRKDRVSLQEDDTITIVASVTEALRAYTELEKSSQWTVKKIGRLLGVCLGGIIFLTKSNLDKIIDLLLCLGAEDLLSKVDEIEVNSVLDLIRGRKNLSSLMP